MTLIVVTRESHLISHHIMMTTRPMMKRIKIAPALTVEPSPTSNINIPRSATMLQGCIFLHKIYFIPATRNTIFFSSQMRMNLTWNSFKISRTFNFYEGGGMDWGSKYHSGLYIIRECHDFTIFILQPKFHQIPIKIVVCMFWSMKKNISVSQPPIRNLQSPWKMLKRPNSI